MQERKGLDEPVGLPGEVNPALRGLVEFARLRVTRLSTGLTQEQAAVYAGCSRNTLQRLEAGRSAPKVATLRRLLDLYGSPQHLNRFLSIEDFIDRGDIFPVGSARR